MYLNEHLNEQKGEWTDLVNEETIMTAEKAKRMKEKGLSVKDIAAKLKKSVSRIYELLKE